MYLGAIAIVHPILDDPQTVGIQRKRKEWKHMKAMYMLNT